MNALVGSGEKDEAVPDETRVRTAQGDDVFEDADPGPELTPRPEEPGGKQIRQEQP